MDREARGSGVHRWTSPYQRGSAAVRGHVEEAPVIALLASLEYGYPLGLLFHRRD